MQSLIVNMPQALRVKLQEYQNEHGIAQSEAAIVAVLQDYFQSWSAATSAKLPEMYDAEDGPCEVISSFLEPKTERG